eukprot:TRINITY_DN4653_c0_g2_i6.p1 TRINITY_DN4653_c0_g2~~TRINITY_DN4653_c0_g2_i6.p1  ORF type:complete len:1197 (+),score=286.14 TRINITY_DN4653_c0_g2_i6:735-4325(+)
MSKRSRFSPFLESCLRLKYQVVPEIKNEIALKCAREQLSEFRYELKEALQQGIYFLYHVFRDSRKIKPESVTVSRMMRCEGETMETSSGKLLLHILMSGAFLEAFPDDSVEIRKRLIEVKLEVEDVSTENRMDTASLFDKEGKLIMPLELFCEMTGIEPSKIPCSGPVPLTKERLAILFDKKYGVKKTGIELGFHSHPYVAEQFVKSHASLQELAKFVQIIIKAEKCAGGGGDLLIYGFANKQLNALLETYRALVKTVRSQFEILTRIAELRFQQLVDRNQAEPERNTFIPHYRQIHTKFYHFDNQLLRTEDCCEEILNKANSLTLYERFNKLKRDTEDFISSADMFAGHLNNVLHIPYNSAIGQEILLEGPNIPNVELLLKTASQAQVNAPANRGKEKDIDMLPGAFELLESSSAGTIQLHKAPPQLLCLMNKPEQSDDVVDIQQFNGLNQVGKVQSVPVGGREDMVRSASHLVHSSPYPITSKYTNDSNVNSRTNTTNTNPNSTNEQMTNYGHGNASNTTYDNNFRGNNNNNLAMVSYQDPSGCNHHEILNTLNNNNNYPNNNNHVNNNYNNTNSTPNLPVDIKRLATTVPDIKKKPLKLKSTVFESSSLVTNPSKSKKDKEKEKDREKDEDGEKSPNLKRASVQRRDTHVASETMNLVRLQDVTIVDKPPKITIPYYHMNISASHVAEFCMQLDPKLRRLKNNQGIIEVHDSFPSTEALVRFITFLESHIEKIHTLDLSHNKMDFEVADALHHFLGHPGCVLRKLSCNDCNLNDNHIFRLAEIMKFNKTLRKLNLRDNKLSDDTVLAINVSFIQNELLPLKKLALQRTADKTNADSIPYTEPSIELMEPHFIRYPKLIVTFHNDVELVQGAPNKVRAFNKYRLECLKRKSELEQTKIQALEKLKAKRKSQLGTLTHFKDLIRICQVYQRSTGEKEVPFKVIAHAFANGIYGVVPPPTELMNHVSQAIHLGVLVRASEEDGAAYLLSKPALCWEIPLPERIFHLLVKDGKELDIPMLWQLMLSALVGGLVPMSPHQKVMTYLTGHYSLMSYDQEVLEIMLELVIIRGVLYKDEQGLYQSNDTKTCPVDFTKFPGYRRSSAATVISYKQLPEDKQQLRKSEGTPKKHTRALSNTMAIKKSDDIPTKMLKSLSQEHVNGRYRGSDEESSDSEDIRRTTSKKRRVSSFKRWKGRHKK